MLVLGLKGCFLLFKEGNRFLKFLELSIVPLLSVVKAQLDLLVFLVELFN